MNKTITLIFILVIFIIGIGGYFLFKTGESAQTPENGKGDAAIEKNTASIEDSMIEGDVVIEKDTASTEDSIMEADVKTFEISGRNFEFSVEEIRVKKGDAIRIVFTSESGFHDWVIDKFNARTKQLQSPASETIEFVADEIGEFEYYCSVGKHRAMGMVGTLIVE